MVQKCQLEVVSTLEAPGQMSTGDFTWLKG